MSTWFGDGADEGRGPVSAAARAAREKIWRTGKQSGHGPELGLAAISMHNLPNCIGQCGRQAVRHYTIQCAVIAEDNFLPSARHLPEYPAS